MWITLQLVHHDGIFFTHLMLHEQLIIVRVLNMLSNFSIVVCSIICSIIRVVGMTHMSGQCIECGGGGCWMG